MNHPELSPAVATILKELTAAQRPLSAYDVLERVRPASGAGGTGGIKSPPTVYRALDRLVALGLIHRLESLNAYVACCQHGAQDCDHNHTHGHEPGHISQFAICTMCGTVKEIEDKALRRLANSGGAGFLSSVDKTVFEISGVCRACAA